MATKSKIKRTRHDYMLFCMATFNYNMYRRSLSDFEPIKMRYQEFLSKLNFGNISRSEFNKITTEDDIIRKISEFGFEIRMYGIQTIINSTLTLEAFINDLGAIMTSESYFQSHLDKLDLVSKWILIPKLVFNKEINKTGQGYENLKFLVSNRNKLIHSKSKNIIDDNNRELAMNKFADQMIQVPKCYQTIKLLLEEIRMIAPNYEMLGVYKNYKIEIGTLDTYMNSIMYSN